MTQPGADLHLHSTASDGALSPSEVVRHAARVGLSVIALTDHDSVAGFAEGTEAGSQLGVRVLSGVELSVSAPWGEMHLLAYGIDPTDPALDSFLSRATELRRNRGLAIISALDRLGVRVTIDEVLAVANGAPIGRPHVARALVTRRVVRSIDEAFDRFLGRGRPANVSKVLPTIEQATALVRSAGGICSAAHLKDRGTREGLQGLKARGVDAIEVRHPGHPPSVQAALEHLVRDLGMLPTGGSDWHGNAERGPTHGSIGAERIPLDWVTALDRAILARRP